MFAPEKYISRVFRHALWLGSYKHSLPIPFGGATNCTAIASKRNIACLTSQDFVYVVRLDRLLLTKAVSSGKLSEGVNGDSAYDVRESGDGSAVAVSENCDGSALTPSENDDKHCNDTGGNNVVTRVRAPVANHGQQLTSAIYHTWTTSVRYRAAWFFTHGRIPCCVCY